MAEQPVTACAIAQLELEVPIGAPPDRVWQALVRDTTHWWRPDFYCLPKRTSRANPDKSQAAKT